MSAPHLSSVPVSSVDGPAALAQGSDLIAPPARPGLLGAIEQYELVKVLGAGGMGRVFLARDTSTGKQVALKMLRPEYNNSPDLTRRFSAEARNQQKLKHPKIAPLLEVKELENGAFFTMPLFENGSLARRIRPNTPLTAGEILEIATSIAEALVFAHTRGIIHRDIKPANILLGPDGSGCLADFGLARSLLDQSVVEVERDPEGTAPYLSPAMAAGQAEDTRCDIYGFGALLYEMLTGSPPYAGTSLAEIRAKILDGPPEPMRKRNPKADPKLVQIAEGAMAREPRDRYATMEDVLADLKLLKTGKLPLGPHRPWRPWKVATRVLKLTWPAGALLMMALAARYVFWPSFRLEVIRTISSTNVNTWTRAIICERDGSPGREIVVQAGGAILTFSGVGEWLATLPLPPVSDPRHTALQPIRLRDDDAADHLSVSWTVNSNLMLSIVNDHQLDIARFQLEGPAPSPSNIVTAALLSPRFLPGKDSIDGRRKLLALKGTNAHGGPRALCCFDFDTRRLDWHREAGCAFAQPLLYDANNDGTNEIILGSFAPDNGIQAPDGSTDDSHSYAFAFDTRGNKLWQTNLAGALSNVRLLLARWGGRKPDIVAWVCVDDFYHTNHAQHAKVAHLSAFDGRERTSYQFDTCLCDCMTVDIDRDGRDEILGTDCEGFLHIFYSDLQRHRKVRFYEHAPFRSGTYDKVENRLIGAGHLLSSKRVYLVLEAALARRDKYLNAGNLTKPKDLVRYEDRKIVVLDDHLRPVAEHIYQQGQAVPTLAVSDMDGDDLDEIVSMKETVEVLKLRKQ